MMLGFSGVPLQDRYKTLGAIAANTGLGNLGMGELKGAGASNEQLSRIYNAAQGLGLSTADLAQATGYSPEQITSWAGSQGLGGLPQQTERLYGGMNAGAGGFDMIPINPAQQQMPQAAQQAFGQPMGGFGQQPTYIQQYQQPLVSGIMNLLSGGYGGIQNYGGFGLPMMNQGYGYGYQQQPQYGAQTFQGYQPQAQQARPMFGGGFGQQMGGGYSNPLM